MVNKKVNMLTVKVNNCFVPGPELLRREPLYAFALQTGLIGLHNASAVAA